MNVVLRTDLSNGSEVHRAYPLKKQKWVWGRRSRVARNERGSPYRSIEWVRGEAFLPPKNRSDTVRANDGPFREEEPHFSPPADIVVEKIPKAIDTPLILCYTIRNCSLA